MGTLMVILFLVLVGPLSLVYGADSRDRYDRPRSWWPAAKR
ncbi:MAG TPA: hypothetical protein VE777_16260 [Gaiellales bacterium]|nr:hypothetical protein [Gaiellales bacterium]